MFLCENCHNPAHVHFSYSYGPCEGCHKTAECIDCHADNPWKPKPNGTGILKKVRKPMAKPMKVIKSKKQKRLDKIHKKEETDERN